MTNDFRLIVSDMRDPFLTNNTSGRSRSEVVAATVVQWGSVDVIDCLDRKQFKLIAALAFVIRRDLWVAVTVSVDVLSVADILGGPLAPITMSEGVEWGVDIINIIRSDFTGECSTSCLRYNIITGPSCLVYSGQAVDVAVTIDTVSILMEVCTASHLLEPEDRVKSSIINI